MNEWITATAPLKKLPYMKKWTPQADPPKEGNTVQKMNGQSVLLSPNKTKHYFKEWTTASCVLKKIYCLYKNVILQIDPLSTSYSEKLQYPERELRL